ncbi:MAG: hypothetical protein HYZ29_02220 [Myxococcales bacterium]|nr:hypothetical protein [Myxococcales bacterium]
MRIQAFSALALLLASPGVARAADPPEAAEPVPYWVDFQAGRVELDPELMKLELSRKVSIVVDRYRLTSERLTLSRTRRGVEIEGEGRVAFCPCENAPISFGFQKAIVAPPTDLFVQGATVRVGDVPVLWTPILWLRSPDRLGLLPPRLAWRAEEGLSAGTGVHVPIGGKRGPTLSALDVSAAGYLRGGVDVETRLSTPGTSTRVRWDHQRDSLLALDAHGAGAGRDGAAAALRIDAIRGARGLAGTLELEPVSRRWDHARASLSGASEHVVGALGGVAVAERGAAMDAGVAAGPVAALAFGGALGAGSSADTFVEASTLRERGQASVTLLVHHASVAAATNLGPLWVSAQLDEHTVFESREREASASAFAGTRLMASAPLARAFGDGTDPLVHRVEPFLDAGVRVAERRGQSADVFRALEAAPTGRLALGAAGVSSALGRDGAREALEVELRGGALGDLDAERVEPAAGAELAADSEWVGARVESAARLDSDRELYQSGRLRFGRADALHVEGHVTGGLDDAPLGARTLLSDHFAGSVRPYLERAGWSAGARLGVPWTRQLASEVGTEADVSSARLLAWRAALGYRHPCGCFSLLGRTGQRIGREGLDVDVTLDLMP